LTALDSCSWQRGGVAARGGRRGRAPHAASPPAYRSNRCRVLGYGKWIRLPCSVEMTLRGAGGAGGRAALEDLEVGQVVAGRVKRIERYGVFVEVPPPGGPAVGAGLQGLRAGGCARAWAASWWGNCMAVKHLHVRCQACMGEREAGSGLAIRGAEQGSCAVMLGRRACWACSGTRRQGGTHALDAAHPLFVL